MGRCRVYLQTFFGDFLTASQTIAILALFDQFDGLINTHQNCNPVALLGLGHGLLLHCIHARQATDRLLVKLYSLSVFL